jgi:membrane associated rhomboid family serine protease
VFPSIPDSHDISVREPILNLPPGVAVLVLANIAVHLVRLVLPEQIDWELVAALGFVPARFTTDVGPLWLALLEPVTHMFLHGGWLHLIVNMTSLMAFGTAIERRWGLRRFLLFALLCGIAAAGTHLAIYPRSVDPVIGASGAISGLFGAVLLLLRRVRTDGRALRFWPVVGIFVLLNIATGYTGLPGDGGTPIAWAAHLGGFAAGLLLFGLFEPRRRAEAQPWG